MELRSVLDGRQEWINLDAALRIADRGDAVMTTPATTRRIGGNERA